MKYFEFLLKLAKDESRGFQVLTKKLLPARLQTKIGNFRHSISNEHKEVPSRREPSDEEVSYYQSASKH